MKCKNIEVFGIDISKTAISQANEKGIIGEGSLIDGNGELTIGKNSLLARGVVLLSGNHVFEDPTVPIRFQGTKAKKVTIGEDVWLGVQVVVLPGVTIGDGTVIGAGAVVTEDIPSYSLAVGVPAKVIGKRVNKKEIF